MTKPLTQRRRRLTSILIRSGLQWLLFAGLLLPAVAMAQAAPILEVVFDPIPAGQYQPGDSIPVSLKFSNTGDADATPGSMTLTLPVGVTVTARDCIVVSGGPSGSSCGNSVTGSGGGLYTGATIKPSGALQVGATLKFDANAVGNKLITATFSATGVAAASVNHTFVRIPTTDLAVTVTAVATSPVVGNCPGDDATYTPSCAATYTVEVKNNGPDAANGATLSIARTEVGHTAFNWACDAAGTGATCPSASGTGPLSNAPIATFPSGGTLTYTVTVNHGVDDDFPEAKITAAIVLPTTPADMVDTNTNNNSDSAQRNRNDAANLKVTATRTTIASPASNCPDGSGTQPGYTPGCVATYRVEYRNDGPDAANGSTLNLARSEDLAAEFEWTCTGYNVTCPAAAGTGSFSNLVITSFPANGKLVFDITVSHPSSALYSTAGIVAEVWPPPNGGSGPIDIDHDDNSSEVIDAIDRRAAIRVEKRAVVNGEPVDKDALPSGVFANNAWDYEITVYNDGPSDVGNAAGGTVDADGPALVLTDVLDPRLTGVNNTNDCNTADSKPCWSFCRSSLGLNPEDGMVTVASCDPADVVTGSNSTGEILERFALSAGTGSRLFTRVNFAQTTNDVDIENKAEVSLSDCSGVQNCAPLIVQISDEEALSDSVTVKVKPSAAATITVKNSGGVTNQGITSATPGTQHSYTIKVENSAFSHLPDTDIEGTFPLQAGSVSGFIPDSIYYRCSAHAQASCATLSGQPDGQAEPTPPVYATSLNTKANLPSGGWVEYTVTGILDPRAEGIIELSAAVTPSGMTSVQDEVETTMAPVSNLTLSKRSRGVVEDAGTGTFRVEYEIEAVNAGPSFAKGIVVADNADTNGGSTDLDFSSAKWTCATKSALTPALPETKCSETSEQTGGIGGSGQPLTVDLMPQASATVSLAVSTAPGVAGPVTNTARIVHGAVTLDRSDTTALTAEYSFIVEKSAGADTAYPGSAHTYAISVVNEGPDNAFGVHVQDIMPSALQNVTWTCAATSPVPGDLAELQAVVDKPGQPGNAVVMTTSGHHVYVLSRSPTGEPMVLTYKRHATPGLKYGELDAVPIDEETNGADDPKDSGSVVTGMNDPIDLALSKDERVLYVLSADGMITAFQRTDAMLNPDFGQLSFAGSVQTAMSHPRRIAMSATHIYVSGYHSSPLSPGHVNYKGQIEVFRPDNNNQLPVAVAGGVEDAPVSAPATSAPIGLGHMVVDALRSKLYVASTTTSEVRRYSIATSGPSIGALTLDGKTASNENGYEIITGLLLAPNGRDLYVRPEGNGSAVQIGHISSGESTLQFAALYTVPGLKATWTSDDVHFALSPDGEHLIGVYRGKNAMFSIRRNPVTGGLANSVADNTSPKPVDVQQWLVDRLVDSTNFGPDFIKVDGLSTPAAVLVTPDNRHVLVASASTSGAIGPLSVFSRRAPEPQLGFIERDQDGDVIDPNQSNQNTIDSLVAPADVATRGLYVYVLSKVDSAVSLFERRIRNVGPDEEDGGHLTFKGSWRNGQGGVISGMANPDRLLISPNGENLFVSSADGNSVAVFKRNLSDGTLEFLQAFQASGNPGIEGALGMAMDSGSANLYVAGSYASSIAVFSRNPSDLSRFVYKGRVVSGQNGVTGLNGIRDLVVAGQADSSQLLGVSDAANTVVVFDRESDGPNAGQLSFTQSLSLGANQRPMALALSPNSNNTGNAHVYVVTQNTNALYVLKRVQDSTDPQSGRVRIQTVVTVGNGAPQGMAGPRDVTVSGDGKRVYVTGEYGHGLVAFDRYDNASSANYGNLAFAEVRVQDVDAVDGIKSPYAVAVSEDSRNVYVVGFDSNAVASFSVGTGSFCSASGTGDIDDTVTIRAGGAVVYTVNATIRPDATGELSNTVKITRDGDDDPSDTAEAITTLEVSANLKLTKTNNEIAVVPGNEVTYDITVTNDGPSNVVGLDDPSKASVSDLFGVDFDLDTIRWTCAATGSGMLDYLLAYRDGDASAGGANISGLRGISSLALIPGNPAATGTDKVRRNFLVGASVDDDAVVFFQRDPATGALSYYAPARIDNDPTTPLLGARSVAVSADGRLLFVASRQSDSLNVFSLTGSDAQDLIVTRIATATATASVPPTVIRGLDKALHVIALPADDNGIEHVYVAGANDHAIAAFRFDRDGDGLVYIASQVNGVGGVLGLADVEYLVPSPDGSQVYALSGSGASVTLFNRNSTTGQLAYVQRYAGGLLGVNMNGVSSGVFSANGRYLYLTASGANGLVQLERVTDSGAGNFGALTAKHSIAQGEQETQGLLNPRRVAISDDGHHLYVTSQAGATIAWFSLQPESGKPSYQGIRANHSSGITGLAGATGMVLDPVLDQIYVAGTLDQSIVHFQRTSDSWCPPNGTGVLDQVPVNIAVGGQVSFQVTVRVSSQLPGKLVNIATVDWQSAADWTSDPGPHPDGDGVVTCTRQDSTHPWSCSGAAKDEDEPSRLADLSITKDDGLAEYDGLAGASAIVADKFNAYVAAPDDNGIGVFAVTDAVNDAGLRYLGVMRSGEAGVSGLTAVSDLILSAGKNHLYAVSPSDGAISVFARDYGNGHLDFIEKHQNGLLGVTGMMGARALALSPDGSHIYVAGEFSNSIAIFQRETQSGSADFGKLQFKESIQAGIGGVNGIESSRALALSPDGKQLYVLGGAGTLVAFSRQANSGSGNFGKLTQIARYQNATGGVLGMDEVRSLVVTADGKNLYVLGAAAGSLVHFSRDEGDGTLSFVPDPVTGGSLLVPGLVGASRLRMGADGHLYVAAKAQNAIVVFELDAAGTPLLAHTVQQGDDSTMPAVDGLDGASDVAMVNDVVPRLYVGAAGGTDALAALSIFQLSASGPGYVGSLFDGMGGVAPGSAVTYTIVVTNHGPSGVPKARVVDIFPPEFQQVSWTCTGYLDGECLSGQQQGNLDLEVKLPNGAHVQIEATGIVRDQAAGRLINTATVEAIAVNGITVPDPDMSNNSATDDDTTLSPRVDLSITVDDDGCDHSDPACVEVTEATPGSTIAYRVIASNAGPSYAKQARVSDTLPSALYDVSWTCAATPQAGLLNETSLVTADFDTAYRAVAIDPLGRHVYAVGSRTDTNGVRDTLVAFARNPLNGKLTRVQAYSDPSVPGEPVAQSIAGAVDVVVSRDGRFVYVAGQDADAISVFERNQLDGKLTWRSRVIDSEQGVDGIGGVQALALSPDGKHLYAAGVASPAIAGFTINATTGALSQASVIRQGGGINGLNGISDLAFDESGGVLFVSATTNSSVSALRRNVATGALTSLAVIEDGQVGLSASLLSPSALWVSGDRVFVADAQGDAVNLLRFVDGDAPEFKLDAVIRLDNDNQERTQEPVALAFVADQERLYVASKASGQMHLYSLLGATPELLVSYDQNASSAIGQVSSFVVSPNDRQLHVISDPSGSPVARAQINTMAREFGSRCPLQGQGGLGEQRVDIAPGGAVQFDVAGHIFANATDNLIYAVVVDPHSSTQEVDPSDNRDNDIDALVPAPDLETRKLRQTPADEVVAGLPVNWLVEVENHGISDALRARVIDDFPIFPGINAGLVADTGAWSCAGNLPLAHGGRLTTTDEPRVADLSALVSTADGRRWFGISRSSDALVELRLDVSGDIESVQTLFDASTLDVLAGASHLALSPDETSLYVTSTVSDALRTGRDLSEAERNGDSPLAVVTGNLLVFGVRHDGLDHLQTLTSGVELVIGLRGARQVVSSADGNFVYVAAVPSNINSSTIALFRRDADSGQLSFVERIQDGMGTFGNASNVIRDLQRMYLTADGHHLYTLARGSSSQAQPEQQALARFDINPASGKLRYVNVMRAVDIGSAAPVVPALLGARDLVVTPGDTQLYVLSSQGVVQFSRALNGSLALVATWPTGIPIQTHSMAMDTWGSRLYVVDVEGTVHLYARQWDDGALENRYSLPAATSASPGVLIHTGPTGELLLAQSGSDGGLTWMFERAISLCLQLQGGNADLPTQVDLGVNGWTRLDYAATVHPSARGNLLNIASSEPSRGFDPDLSNNVASDETLIHVQSDLSITKTGPVDAVAGEYIDYVIRVDNAGPSDALGIHVKDDLDPAMFQDATWACAVEGDGDSACDSANGGGASLDVLADLHVGDALVVTLRVKVNPAWLGAMQNAAYVVPEPGSVDPSPGDQTATPVETIVVRRADVVVTKSTSVAEVVAGAAVGYTITVHNAGPSDAPDVDVRDALPARLRDAHWTCATQLGTGGCGDLTGTGSINQHVSIPVGETLTFQLDATLSPAADGTLTNTATASVRDDPAGDVLDPDTDNNTATVEDVVLQRADLSLTAIAPDAYDPDSTAAMPYRFEVNNLGPSNAALSVVVVKFSHTVTQSNSNCVPLATAPPQGSQFNCSIASLAAGAMTTFDLGIRQLPSVPATLVGNLSIGSQTQDPVPGNNTASTSTEMRTGVDLEVVIDDGQDGLAPGDATRYTIKVRNVGSVDAIDARVLVPLANELLPAATWQCTAPVGAHCSGSGIGDIDDLINLPAGASLTYMLDVTLDPGIDSLVQDSYEQTAEVEVSADQTEVSTQNNTASDINLIYKVIFKDGFEEPVTPRPAHAALSVVWPGPIPVEVVPMPDAALPSPPARASVRRLYTRAGGLT